MTSCITCFASLVFCDVVFTLSDVQLWRPKVAGAFLKGQKQQKYLFNKWIVLSWYNRLVVHLYLGCVHWVLCTCTQQCQQSMRHSTFLPSFFLSTKSYFQCFGTLCACEVLYTEVDWPAWHAVQANKIFSWTLLCIFTWLYVAVVRWFNENICAVSTCP